MIPSNGTITLQAGTTETITSQVSVNGNLTIKSTATSNLPIVFNDRTGTTSDKAVTGIKLDGTDSLSLENIRLKGKSYPLGTKWYGNFSVEVNGGNVIFNNVELEDGNGCVLHKGKIDGNKIQTINSTYGYSLYLGNVKLSDDSLCYGSIKNSDFLNGRQETSFRLMGFRGSVKNCTFYSKTDRHKKETLQGRHGNFVIRGCKSWSVVIGPLSPNVDMDYTVYAEKFPTYVHVNNHEMAGYFNVEGKAFVAIDGLEITGKDPRVVGGDTAITLETFTSTVGTHAPKVYIKNVSISEFTKIAPGVIVGPNCKINGLTIPQSASWDDAEFARIVKEAEKFATVTPPTPIDPKVLSLDIVNKAGQKLIADVTADIDLSKLGTNDFSFVANCQNAGSVKFFLDNELANIENTAPFALFGDSNGTFVTKVFDGIGYVLTAIPFSGSGGTGPEGKPLRVKFITKRYAEEVKPVSVELETRAWVTYPDGTREEITVVP